MEIWQLTRQQANELYLTYSIGVFTKDFELRNQINPASGLVMDNITEGFKRSGNKEFSHFLLIAKNLKWRNKIAVLQGSGQAI